MYDFECSDVTTFRFNDLIFEKKTSLPQRRVRGGLVGAKCQNATWVLSNFRRTHPCEIAGRDCRCPLRGMGEPEITNRM